MVRQNVHSVHGAECESVVHVLWECPVYGAKLKEFAREDLESIF